MDLSTTYLGLQLKNPLVPSASPLSRTIGSAKIMEDYGASAIVLYSIFEEQIRHETKELYHHLTYHAESYAEATSYFPDPTEYHSPDRPVPRGSDYEMGHIVHME